MLIPIGYPAGKGKGKDFYLLRLAGKGTKEIDRYANGRVNALPLPYPAHCHSYSKSPDGQLWTVLRVRWSKISGFEVQWPKLNRGKSWMVKNELFPKTMISTVYVLFLSLCIYINTNIYLDG
jgi:hypothetical protein